MLPFSPVPFPFPISLSGFPTNQHFREEKKLICKKIILKIFLAKIFFFILLHNDHLMKREKWMVSFFGTLVVCLSFVLLKFAKDLKTIFINTMN